VLLQIPRDHEQRIKGFGFITFEDFDSMERAIKKVCGLLGTSFNTEMATSGLQAPQQACCY
jgi:hypothetical protein